MRSLPLVIGFALALPALSSPIRRSGPSYYHPPAAEVPNSRVTNSGNASSGSGGTAKGGSIKGPDHAGVLGILGGDGSLLDAFSKNGGHGGTANSGSASSEIRGGRRWGYKPHGKGKGGSIVVNSGNAYSGPGGNADGGDAGSGGLINLWSDNGGDGGTANSGSSDALIHL